MVADETGQEPPSGRDSRLNSLDERLKRVEQAEGARRPAVDPLAGVRSTGARAMQSMVGMPFGGGVIGWLLDRLLGTAPWIMLGLIFLGFAGGVIDVLKFSKQEPDRGAGK